MNDFTPVNWFPRFRNFRNSACYIVTLLDSAAIWTRSTIKLDKERVPKDPISYVEAISLYGFTTSPTGLGSQTIVYPLHIALTLISVRQLFLLLWNFLDFN